MEKEKVTFVIICYNISSLIKLQLDCLRKFCLDDYDVLVVDNSSDLKIAEEIKYFTSIEMNCTYIKTSASSLNGSASHAFASGVAYLKVKDHPYVVFLDHDLFPVKEFSVIETLGDKYLAGIGQAKGEHTYMWPGALYINNKIIDKELVDLSPDHSKNMDTGGRLYLAIERYGKDACVFFDEMYEQNPNFTKSSRNFYAMINGGTFLHFLSGSNWDGLNDHQERINSLINIVKEKTGL